MENRIETLCTMKGVDFEPGIGCSWNMSTFDTPFILKLYVSICKCDHLL